MVKDTFSLSKKSFIKFLLILLSIILNSNFALASEKRILIDSIHAHNFLDKGLTPDNYSYHEIHGLSLAFNYLKSERIQVDEIKTGTIRKNTLSSYNMLFINLVSEDLPAFTVEEIISIKNFVHTGGSLFIITDHSNCYHHIYKLTPLLLELGIKSFKETACDVWPHTIGEGNGWINIDNFKRHSITENLKNVVFQTGGTVDSRYAVATTSKNGWGDFWTTHLYGQDDGSRGFYGNWEKDIGERTGELGVVLARKFGRGKIVIVADQNVFGNEWIKYADNYKLFLNIISWLLDDNTIKDFRKFIVYKKPRIMLFEDYPRASFGITYKGGYYNTFTNINRYFWSFTRDEIDYDYNLIIFPPHDYKINANQINLIKKHLNNKKNIVIFAKKGHLSKSNGFLIDTITDKRSKIKEIVSNGNIVEYHLQNAGKIIVLLNAEKLSNDFLNSPTQQPTLKQKQKAYQIEDIIDEYLPCTSHTNTAVSLGYLQIKSQGFLNYYISDGNISNDNLFLDNSFRFFQPENYIRYNNFYKYHNIQKRNNNKDFPLIINANYPLKIVRKVRAAADKTHTARVALTLTLTSPEGKKIKTYKFDKNLYFPDEDCFTCTLGLPRKLGKYKLQYSWKLALKDGQKKIVRIYRETQNIYLLLKEPVKECRLYLSLIDKSIGWISKLKNPAAENIINTVFDSIWSLGEKGYYYKYGGYTLPENSRALDKLDIFIDHKAVSCGELRCLMLNVTGYYGIKGQEYLMIGKKENWYDRSYVIFKTRRIRAFGPKSNIREWIHWNHDAVLFNGIIYDPTFHIKATSFKNYAKNLFVAFGRPATNLPCNQEHPWCYKKTNMVEFISKDKITFPLKIEISSALDIYR